MINIAVCDDVIAILLETKEIIQKHKFEENIIIDTFLNGEELYKKALNVRYDILIMDIELTKDKKSGKNGMEVSSKIKEMYPDVLVIFFTGYMSYKSALLNFEPFRFIAKPFKEAEIIEAVNAAILRVNGWKNNFFCFKTNGKLFRIKLKKIIFFESTRPYIYVNTIDDNDCVKLRGKMDDIEKEIKEISNDFLRVNKSTLINKEYIERCSTKEVVLMDGKVVSVGRKYVKDVSKMFFEI